MVTPAQKIQVKIVDANNITIGSLIFKPPKKGTVIVQEVEAIGHGKGYLEDAGGYTVPRDEDVPPGEYIYHVIAVTGPTTAAPVATAPVTVANRDYIVIGLQNNKRPFSAAVNVSFEEVQTWIKKLWPFFANAEFVVFLASDVNPQTKGDIRKRAVGKELDEAKWKAYLGKLSASEPVRLIVKPKGNPFSDYNALSTNELAELVKAHSGFRYSEGQPQVKTAIFTPPSDLISPEMYVPWDDGQPEVVKTAMASAGAVEYKQHSCPICHAPTQAATGGGAHVQCSGPAARTGPTDVEQQQQDAAHASNSARPSMRLKHMVAMIAHTMVWILSCLRSAQMSAEVMHRGFVDMVLSTALLVARSFKPSAMDQPYMRPEYSIVGRMAWGKVDYMLVYRALAIMVVEVKSGTLDSAWGQAFMQMCALREALAKALQTATTKKRSYTQAFSVDMLKTFALICSAGEYRLVLWVPKKGIWESGTIAMPLGVNTTVKDLVPKLTHIVSMVAYAIKQQVDWMDDAMGQMDEDLSAALKALPGSADDQVKDAETDHLINSIQSEGEEDSTEGLC